MNKIEHLKMIQEVIARLAHNSFAIKAWSLTIFTGATALSFSNDFLFDKRGFILLVFGVITSFYTMDCFYLYLERRYRDLYSTL